MEFISVDERLPEIFYLWQYGSCCKISKKIIFAYVHSNYGTFITTGYYSETDGVPKWTQTGDNCDNIEQPVRFWADIPNELEDKK